MNKRKHEFEISRPQSIPAAPGVPASTVNGIPIIRYSAKGAPDEGQLRRAEKACIDRGWKFRNDLAVIDRRVRDSSGTPSPLDKFISGAKSGNLPAQNPVLIVISPDRITRAQIDTVDAIIWGLVRSGVAVLFESSGLFLAKGDENNLTKRVLLLWAFHQAQFERNRRSQLIRNTFEAKIAGGPVCNSTQLPSWNTRDI
jgi:hypothetical protein